MCDHPHNPEASSFSLTLRQIASWDDISEITEKPEIRASVPVLQRGLVWNPDQIELLWDSILRGFPIGALILSEKINHQTKIKDTARQGITHHLLDGQQRCDAITLGFKDPFGASASTPDTKTADSILWLDLDPSANEWSTREFVVRLSTPSHPWGYTRNDDAKPLGAHTIRQCLKRIGKDPSLEGYHRPAPVELCPQEANVPVPLAWLLLGLQKDDLWANIRSRLPAVADRPWSAALDSFLLDPGKIAHRLRIEQALRRIQETRIIALCAPSDLLQRSRQESDTHPDREARENISNIEHLFQRLNQKGTRLDGEELAYSMIKAYWPELAGPIDQIEKPMPASRLVSLGIRAALPGKSRDSLPASLGVSQIRKLAGKDDETTRLVRDYISNGLEEGCRQLRGWLAYCPQQNLSGLLPVHIANIARDSPDLFLLLLKFAKRPPTDWVIPESGRGRYLQAMVTVVHWFGRDKSTVVQCLYAACEEVISLENIQRGLSEAYSERELRPVHCPESVKGFFNALPESGLLTWNWEELGHGDKSEAEQNKIRDAWLEFFWFRGQKEMLLYAQRDFIHRKFPEYDPARQDFWKGHNRPWDFDHILAGTHVHGKQGDHRPVCKQWVDTIGNFRAWPMEDNRSDQHKSAKDKLSGAENTQKRLDSFVEEEELPAFSHDDETTRWRDPAHEFMKGCRTRMLRIYRDWYESVDVGRILPGTQQRIDLGLDDSIETHVGKLDADLTTIPGLAAKKED
jgi:hypothetical protein